MALRFHPKWAAGLLALSIAAFAVTPSVAQTQSWNFPSDWGLWVGKFPGDTIKGSTFSEIPQVAALLNKYVSASARTDLDDLSVESQIERHGDWIIAVGCMPHECGSQRYVLSVNDKANDMTLCMQTDDDHAHTTTLRWFGKNPATKTLPQGPGARCSGDTAPIIWITPPPPTTASNPDGLSPAQAASLDAAANALRQMILGQQRKGQEEELACQRSPQCMQQRRDAEEAAEQEERERQQELQRQIDNANANAASCNLYGSNC